MKAPAMRGLFVNSVEMLPCYNASAKGFLFVGCCLKPKPILRIMVLFGVTWKRSFALDFTIRQFCDGASVILQS